MCVCNLIGGEKGMKRGRGCEKGGNKGKDREEVLGGENEKVV